MSPSILTRALGPHLVNQVGLVTPVGAPITGLNKIIGLYFSAEWAPNSKEMTEELIALQRRLQDSEDAKDDSRKRLEVIFVSNDQDEDAFARQFESVPWLAIPFEAARKRARLIRLHRVSKLPFLVLLDGTTGRTISRVSSEMLLRDPKATLFPWRPKSLKELLKESNIVDPEGRPVKFEEYKDAYKGVYFSANWCPPCKAFTPQLISVYDKIKERKEDFEIIFISSDRSEDSWRNYHSTMPWPGIHWNDHRIREGLADQLEVKGIPTLFLLDKEFNIISRDGRTLINNDPEAKEFPWRSESVELLRESHMPTVLECPCLILFTEDDPNELQFGIDVLLPVAEEYFAEHSDDSTLCLAFFVAGEDDVTDRLREVANLEDVVPLLTILDLAEGTKYVMEEGAEISNATVHNFVRRYINDALIPIPIHPCEQSSYNEEVSAGDVHTNKQLPVDS